jgi:low temperature requirement protein LtrA
MPPTDFKRASWLELFYDVAFVALVAQLTYLAFAHHHTPLDLFNIFIVGYVIFIAWWATTANRNLKPNETTPDKVSVQIQMVGAFLLSLSMADVFAGEYTVFFLTLSAIRFLQAGAVVRMYYYHPQTRPVTYNILQGFLVGAALWGVSAFVPMPYHIVVTLMALAVDIFTPLSRGRGNTTRYLNVYHLQERLGLFLMLVIGESMIVVALANTAGGFTVTEPSVIFSGLGMMIALWWLYFEHSDLHQGVRPKNLLIFIHSHALLFGSIILLSVGYKLAIETPNTLETAVFIALGTIGIAIALLCIRVMLHNGVVKSILQVLPFFSTFAVIIGVCLWHGWYLAMIVSLTLVSLVGAYVDRKFYFHPNSVNTEKLPN